jgi:uncharacterized protein (DUF1800 family)
MAIHLLNRATFGPRPSDISRVLSMGRNAWLDLQLHPDRIEDPMAASIARKYPSTTLSIRELYEEYTPPKNAASRADAGPDSMMRAAARQARKGKTPQNLLADLASAKLERAVLSDRQLEEVMTDFWFNHFNVFFQKSADRYLVSDYERNAIRPHVFGKFEDLLLATAQHPAMLFYLDNWQSVQVDSTSRAYLMSRIRESQMKPGQPSAPQSRKERGLNENYARELLELHTLGVDGGYTQSDVVNVARALTGWTFVPPRPNPVRPVGRRGTARNQSDHVGFIFRPELHDRGAKVVLGHKLAAGRGIDDGRDVIHILATHPATAHFIATKLVEYFVNDKPDPALVDHVAAVFTKTDGDPREVTRALFSDPLFYSPSNVRAKVKTPFQLVASALRVTGAQLPNPRGAVQALRTMGQLPYMSSPPTGYPAASADWVNSGALLARMNFGIDLMTGKVPGVRPVLQSLTLQSILPGVNTASLEQAITSDVASRKNSGDDPRALAARSFGLAIGSPEFQRR